MMGKAGFIPSAVSWKAHLSEGTWREGSCCGIVEDVCFDERRPG